MKVAPFVASNLLSAGVGLVSLATLTRLLGPAQFGTYVALLALAATLQNAGFLWLQNGLLRTYAKCPDGPAANDLASAAKAGFVLASIAVACIWCAGALLANTFLPTILWSVGLPLLLIGGWMTIARSWLRVRDRQWRFIAVEAVQTLGALILSVLALLLLGAAPVWVIVGSIAAGLLATLLSSDLLRQPFMLTPAARAKLGELWRYGAPLTLVAFLTSIMAISDRILIAALVGTPAAGAYAVGYAIADRAITLVLVPVTLAMKPTIFASFESGAVDETRTLLSQSGQWLMVIGLPVTTLLVCAPAPLVALFAGGGLARQAEAVLPLVAIGSLLGALLSLHFGLAFQLASRTGGMIAVLAPAAAANVVANLLLLPVYGVIAAAWTTLATYAFALCLSAYLGRRHYLIPFPLRDALVSGAACIPLAVVLRWGPVGTLLEYLLTAGAAAILYLISLTLLYWLTRSPRRQDESTHAMPEGLS